MNEPKTCCGTTNIILVAGRIVKVYLIISITFLYFFIGVISNAPKNIEPFETAAYIGCILFPLEIISCFLVSLGIRIRQATLLFPFVIWSLVCLVMWTVLAMASIINIQGDSAVPVIYGNFVGLVVGGLCTIYCVYIVNKTANYLQESPNTVPRLGIHSLTLVEPIGNQVTTTYVPSPVNQTSIGLQSPFVLVPSSNP